MNLKVANVAVLLFLMNKQLENAFSYVYGFLWSNIEIACLIQHKMFIKDMVIYI